MNNFLKRKNKLKEILSINWFKYNWNKYLRDDWYYIDVLQKEYKGWYYVVDWEWNAYQCKNQEEMIWFLSLKWIINRLF